MCYRILLRHFHFHCSIMTILLHVLLPLLFVIPVSFSLEGFDFVFTTDPEISSNTPRALLATKTGDRLSLPENAFTFCFYSYLESTPDRTVYLVSYALESGSDNEVYLEATFKEKPPKLGFGILGQEASFRMANLEEWTHICGSWNGSSGRAHLFINGKDQRGANSKMKKGQTVGGKGCLILGQEQDSCDGDYDGEQGMKGRLTQFHLWDRELTEAEVNQVMANTLSGEVVDWTNSSWRYGGGILVEQTTAPTFTSACGSTNETPCLNIGETRISPYDLESGFEDGFPSEVTGTLKNVRFPAMKEFSFCFALYRDIDKYDLHAVTYKDQKGEPVISVGYMHDPQPSFYFTVGNEQRLATDRYSLFRIVKFLHLCGTWSATTGELTFYLHGNVSNEFENVSKNYVVPGNGKLIITQEQYAPLDKDKPKEGFIYKVFDFFMWNRLLTKEEVTSHYDCTGSVKGYLVPSSKSQWEVKNQGCPPHSLLAPGQRFDIFPEYKRNRKIIEEYYYSSYFYLPDEGMMKMVSICFWLYSEADNPDVYRFFLEYNTLAIRANNGLEISFNDSNHFTTLPGYTIKGGVWQHVCITWSGDEGTTRLFVNGQKKGEVSGIGTGKVVPKEGSWRYQDVQYAPANQMDPTEGFNFKLADLNVWSYVLSDREVMRAYKCSLVQGNIINSRAAVWYPILGIFRRG